MKRLVFNLLLNMATIAIVAYFLPGINYKGGIVSLAMISVVMAAANIFVKPIIKILTLPIELLTLGLFGVIINAGMLFLVAYFIPQFSIRGFPFAGIDTALITIHPVQIPVWGTAVIASVIIGTITSTIAWLTD